MPKISISPGVNHLHAGQQVVLTASVTNLGALAGDRIVVGWSPPRYGSITPSMSMPIMVSTGTITVQATYTAPAEAELDLIDLGGFAVSASLSVYMQDAHGNWVVVLGPPISGRAAVLPCKAWDDSPACTGHPCPTFLFNTQEAMLSWSSQDGRGCSARGSLSFALCTGSMPCGMFGPRHMEDHAVDTNGDPSSVVEDCSDAPDGTGTIVSHCTRTITTPNMTTSMSFQAGAGFVEIYAAPTSQCGLPRVAYNENPLALMSLGGWLNCAQGMLTVSTSTTITAAGGFTLTNSCSNCGLRGPQCFEAEWSTGFCTAGNTPHDGCANNVRNPCYPQCGVFCSL